MSNKANILHLLFQTNAPVVDRKLKPKSNQAQTDDKDTSAMQSSRPVSMISTTSSIFSTASDMKPPSIDRKLKPMTPIKVSETNSFHRCSFHHSIFIFQFETHSLHRRGTPSNLSFSATTNDNEFKTDLNVDQFSKTLPRNYNNSASLINNSLASLTLSPQPNPNTRQTAKLEYFDLDHSNPPPICKNSSTSASTSNLSAAPVVGNRLSGFNSMASMNSTLAIKQNEVNIAGATSASGIVYKSVDFVKTEAFMRTRQDAEMNRAKNLRSGKE